MTTRKEKNYYRRNPMTGLDTFWLETRDAPGIPSAEGGSEWIRTLHATFRGKTPARGMHFQVPVDDPGGAAEVVHALHRMAELISRGQEGTSPEEGPPVPRRRKGDRD